MKRWRNPFRKRWVVVLEINTPRRTHRREFGRFMTRTGAEIRYEALTGGPGHPGGQAFAPGVLHIEPLP